MIYLLLAAGVLFTVGTKFWPVRYFGDMWRGTLGTLFKKPAKAQQNGLTPFQAMATALAATVGTGNIAGVATAITAGGPGAIFWMWVSGFFCMMVKYAEIVLAIRFRTKDKNGQWVGGPMEYIKQGMGKRWTWLAVIFAIAGTAASFGVGNITQVNTMADSLRDTFGIPPIITGGLTVLVAGVVIFGGLKVIARVSELLVPFMAGIYIIASLIVIIVKADAILPALHMIIAEAFSPGAVVGGAAGVAVSQAMRLGMTRGLFSHEAGMGSAPIAYASAVTPHPAAQGMWGAMEVFIDTHVICTLTALVVLTTGVWQPNAVVTLDGAPLATAGFSAVLGTTGATVVSVCTALFALGSILGWSFYGQRCLTVLFKSEKAYAVAEKVFLMVYVLILLPGSVMRIDLVWSMADMLNMVMTMPNLIALVALSGTVFSLIREWDKRRNFMR